MTVKVEGLDGFIRHVGQVAAEASKLDVTVVSGIALEAKGVVISTASPHSLSRFANGKGVTLGARFVVTPGKEPSALLFPTPPGPWYLLERGGAAHQIGKRVGGGGRRGRRNQAGFLGNPASGFAAYGPVNHPAFPAKHTWSKSAAAAVAAGEKTFGHVTRQAYVKMFAG